MRRPASCARVKTTDDDQKTTDKEPQKTKDAEQKTTDSREEGEYQTDRSDLMQQLDTHPFFGNFLGRFWWWFFLEQVIQENLY